MWLSNVVSTFIFLNAYNKIALNVKIFCILKHLINCERMYFIGSKRVVDNYEADAAVAETGRVQAAVDVAVCQSLN